MTVTKFVTQDSYADILIANLSYEVSNEDELSEDILVGSDVTFTMRNVRRARSSTPTVDGKPATVVSSADGIVTIQYEWDIDDLELGTPGRYRGMFKIEITEGLNLYSPTLEPIQIIVLPNQDTTP